VKISVVLNMMPPSENSMYTYHRYKKTRMLSEYSVTVRNKIIELIKEQLNLVTQEIKFYSIEIKIFLPESKFYYKNGEVRRLDASNYIKFINDSVAEALGRDDRYVLRSSAEKILSLVAAESYVVIVITFQEVI